jgi:hypothetical protein
MKTMPEAPNHFSALKLKSPLMPSTALTATSLIAFIIVFIGLSIIAYDSGTILNRQIFFLMSAGGCGLACFIAFRCKNRPGPLFPRLWVLTLCFIGFVNTPCLLVGFYFNVAKGFQPLFVSVAGSLAVAALALVPRTFRVMPDSKTVALIAPLSLLFMTFGLIPLGFALNQTASYYNTSPFAGTVKVKIGEGQPVVINPLNKAIDADNDALQLINVETVKSEIGVVKWDNNEVEFKPSKGFYGPATFAYTVRDTKGAENRGWIIVEVVKNEPPRAKAFVVTVLENQPHEFDVFSHVINIDQDPLTLTVHTKPKNGVVQKTKEGFFLYTPNQGFVGVDFMQYTVKDVGGKFDSATITFEVKKNLTPVANVDKVITKRGGKILINPLANDYDPEGLPLTLVSFSENQGGVLRRTTESTLEFTPPDNFEGVVEITYTVEDNWKMQSTGIIEVSIINFDETLTQLIKDFFYVRKQAFTEGNTQVWKSLLESKALTRQSNNTELLRQKNEYYRYQEDPDFQKWTFQFEYGKQYQLATAFVKEEEAYSVCNSEKDECSEHQTYIAKVTYCLKRYDSEWKIYNYSRNGFNRKLCGQGLK